MAAPMRTARLGSFLKFARNIDKRWASKAFVDELARPVTPEELPLDPELAEKLERKELRTANNSGIMRLKTVQLPTRLEKAVSVLVRKYGSKTIKDDARSMEFKLITRKPPLEKDELTILKSTIRKRIIEGESIDPTTLTGQEREDFYNKVDKKCETRIKVYPQWKAKHYNAEQGMAYMVARLAQNYAVLLQILNEIWKRDPGYVPKTLYNFGSGVGSVLWAVQNNYEWKKQITEYYCVDPSIDMNTIARLLLQDGHEEEKMSIKGVFFRKFPPSSSTNTFSLVVSAYTLIESPSKAERLKLIGSLWDMTEDYLILAEIGSYDGYRLIQEAREHILNLQKENEEKHPLVFAPCPHQQPCPKFKLPKKDPCNFEVDCKPLEMVSKSGENKTEKYTYVIIKKAKKDETVKPWPRLIAQSTYASKHIHCRMCCPTGEMDHIIVSKAKHSNKLYKICKKLKLGDYLPVIYTEKSAKKWTKNSVNSTDVSDQNKTDNEQHNLTDSNKDSHDMDYAINTSTNHDAQVIEHFDIAKQE